MKNILLGMVLALTVSLSLPMMPANNAVLDNAGVLSNETINHVVSGNNQLRNATGGEVVFLVENFVPLGGEIENYARDVFNHWALGDAQRNNGVLVVMAVQEDLAWLVAGDGINQQLTGAVLQDIFMTYAGDNFFDGNYDAVTVALFDALADRLHMMFPAAAQVPIQPVQIAQDTQAANGGFGSTIFVLLLIIIIFGGLMVPRRRRGFGGWGRPRMAGMGGFMGGYMIGRANANRRNNSPGRPPMGGGTFGGGGGINRGGYGGGFSRGGSTRGGGGGISRGGMGGRRR